MESNQKQCLHLFAFVYRSFTITYHRGLERSDGEDRERESEKETERSSGSDANDAK